MFPFFFDSTMILLIPGMALALWAQYRVKHTFSKFSEVPSRQGMTGAQVARAILDQNRLDVTVDPIEGSLTDHYDPRDRTLQLSEDVYGSRSIAALGVAAHEAGHAIQHGRHYYPLKIRSNLVPVANFGSTLSWPLFTGRFFPLCAIPDRHRNRTFLLRRAVQPGDPPGGVQRQQPCPSNPHSIRLRRPR